MLTSIAKSHVKFATLADLEYSLNVYITEGVKQKRLTLVELDHLYRYRDYLIHKLGPVHGIVKVAKYHTLFTKAVVDGDHNMFTRGGQHDPESYREVFGFGIATPTSSSSTSSLTGGKGKNGDKSGKKAGNKKPTYPAGSCTNHLLSTSHTTSMCNKK